MCYRLEELAKQREQQQKPAQQPVERTVPTSGQDDERRRPRTEEVRDEALEVE